MSGLQQGSKGLKAGPTEHEDMQTKAATLGPRFEATVYIVWPVLTAAQVGSHTA